MDHGHQSLWSSPWMGNSIVISFDTSALKWKQVLIDGDIESNPGPVSSVEGYRAAIGRFNGKSRMSEKIASCKGIDMIFCLFMVMLFFILFYALAVEIMYVYQAFIPLLILYGCSLSIFCFCIYLYMIQFQKTLREDALRRKSLTDQTLVQFRKVNAYLTDGRVRSSCQELCVANGRICLMVNNGYKIDCEQART